MVAGAAPAHARWSARLLATSRRGGNGGQQLPILCSFRYLLAVVCCLQPIRACTSRSEVGITSRSVASPYCREKIARRPLSRGRTQAPTPAGVLSRHGAP